MLQSQYRDEQDGIAVFVLLCFILRMTQTQSYATISLIGYFRNVIVAVLLQKLCLR